MKISVIIPAHNNSQTISDCLNSLFDQSLLADEIIVVDDGSTDKTANLVKQIKSVEIFSQFHQGPAAARNFGASKAKGDILVFVDADMEFDQQFLKMLTLPIVKGRSKGTWSGNEYVKNWQNVWARCWNFNHNRRTAKMTGSKGQRKVFRAVLKSEFDKVKGFDQIGYTDDWTLVSKLGYPPKPTTAKFYHHNPDSLLKVFKHARWIGKRQYKLGKFGSLMAVFRANALFSVIIGLFKSFVYLTPAFLIFKLVYDLGIMTGALESISNKRY